MMREPDYGLSPMAQLDEEIRYAQSWEDPATVTGGLAIDASSRVLAIASGGDNCLAMLLSGAVSVTAVDMSPAQIALLELKVRAIEYFPHRACMQFLGVLPHAGRLQLYCELQPRLSEFARTYWDRRPGDILAGVIHRGKFERYFGLFRRIMLPLTHSPATVQRLLSCTSTGEQETVYSARWDNRRWRTMFRMFFSRLLLGRLGRDESFFAQVTQENLADELLRRTRRGLTAVPVGDNYFVHYILTGGFRDTARAHPWMHPDRYEELRTLTNRLRCRVGRMGEEADEGTSPYNAFYCSDIYEYMPTDVATSVMQSLADTAAPRARLLYYSLFVPRCLPDFFTPDPDAAASLFARDRTFFYDSVTIGIK